MNNPTKKTFNDSIKIESEGGDLDVVLREIRRAKREFIKRGFTDFSLGLDYETQWAEDGSYLALFASRLETDGEFAKRAEAAAERAARKRKGP